MIYDLLAPFYDAINSDIDYAKWADFIEKIIKKDLKSKAELVLDLGCGTGSMTLELAARGYDTIGIDHSVEMLNIARERADEQELDVLWLCQELDGFELYGTVEVAVCCLDTLNHLTDERTLADFLSLVHNYLSPDGLFIFDVNSKRKFETVYSDRSYVMEEQGAVCIWQNDYDEESRICDFLITLFDMEKDGSYSRYDESECERMYTLSELRDALVCAGLEPIGAYSDFDFNQATDTNCDRIYLVAKCKK